VDERSDIRGCEPVRPESRLRPSRRSPTTTSSTSVATGWRTRFCDAGVAQASNKAEIPLIGIAAQKMD
jgi:hypothetical protein